LANALKILIIYGGNIMEIEIKIGTVIQMEIPSTEYVDLINVEEIDDYPAVLEFTFLPTFGSILDIEVYLFLPLSSQKHFIDGWSTENTADKIQKIKEYARPALDIARERGVWMNAIRSYKKELEEDLYNL
jgi:hypothetical protein